MRARHGSNGGSHVEESSYSRSRSWSSRLLRGRAKSRPARRSTSRTPTRRRTCCRPRSTSHYKKGEYTNTVVDFPNSTFQWDDGFAEATERNREHLVARRPSKQPVDKDTGKRPDYITGQPFPDIREDDPDAGYKVLWNTTYTVYNGGNSHNVTDLNWVSRDRRRAQRRPGRRLPLLRRAAEAVHPADEPGQPALPVPRARR